MADLTRERSVLNVLDAELKSQGFAGSTDVPKLVFLSLYTRFFDEPVSLVLKGPSGSGKSYALDAGLQFVPKEAFKPLSGMTDKALAYMDEDFKHRFLVVKEAAGLNRGKGQVFLRQLLSEHRIDHVTVVGFQPKTLKVEGPIGLLMTTTENALHPEDESRMLSYPIKGSPEKNKAALLGQIGRRRQLDTKPWFALHDFVGEGDHRVSIPWARRLVNKITTSHDRVMRDFKKVVSLIKAHALIHQHNRERRRGRVVASRADYLAVRSLIEGPLSQGLENAVDEFTRQMIGLIADNDDGLSQSEIAGQLGRNQSIVSRHAKVAINQGYLLDMSPGQGRTAKLVLGKRELPSGKFLPEAKELFPKAA
jgi:hypothetical protein